MKITCMAPALAVVLSCVPATAETPRALGPLEFLLGKWEAAGGGTPGEGTGSATFSLSLQDRVMLRSSFAEYPATDRTPATRHDDLMIIHADGAAGLRADYYDSEGHVIRYSVTVPAAGDVRFVSDVVANAPRFQLTYRLASDGLLKGEFSIAPPGKPEEFAPYLTWESRRADTGEPAGP
jgi:hypothetical protein